MTDRLLAQAKNPLLRDPGMSDYFTLTISACTARYSTAAIFLKVLVALIHHFPPVKIMKYISGSPGRTRSAIILTLLRKCVLASKGSVRRSFLPHFLLDVQAR
jgi:hypothetical protein